MQIKKFNNMWLMGIILSGIILAALYLIKFIAPGAIVQVAEIEPIVRLGEYVDTHQWAYYLFTGAISFIVGCIYCCACCRKKHLSWLEHLVVLAEVILLFVIQKFLPEYYLSLNLICMAILPAIICAISKCQDAKCIYSTAITFTVHSVAQLVSLAIRGLSMYIHYPNSATLYILVIDVFMGRGRLYS